MPKKQLMTVSHEEYVDERKELEKYRQASYDSFERVLTTLAGSFLAFSVAFLGALKFMRQADEPLVAPGSSWLLAASWVGFAVSLVSLLLVFFVNARSFTLEITKLEEALEDARALDVPNRWSYVSLVMYSFSALAFVAGLGFLLWFCRSNFIS